jgi:hypothetical protein
MSERIAEQYPRNTSRGIPKIPLSRIHPGFDLLFFKPLPLSDHPTTFFQQRVARAALPDSPYFPSPRSDKIFLRSVKNFVRLFSKESPDL